MRTRLLVLVIGATVAAIVFVLVGQAWVQDAATRAAVASALILGMTAVVVVYYTDETRRMADATKEMARTALVAATAQHGARLVVTRGIQMFVLTQDDPVCGDGPEGSRVRNEGGGTAFAVEVEGMGSVGAITSFPEIRPGKEEPLPEIGESWEGLVRISYSDALKRHNDTWRWDEQRGEWQRDG